MESWKSQRITVYGRVQGVGFRPALCRLGAALRLKGFVRNAGGFVEIVASGSSPALEQLVQQLYALPQPTKVERLEREEVQEAAFARLYAEARGKQEKEFFAAPSLNSKDKSFAPADLAICPSCAEELRQASNRRHGYPYISCAQCGPRYTIMERLPYDRANTTMKSFALCPECQQEYTAWGARRQHAETVSCKRCGPQLYAYCRHYPAEKMMQDDGLKPGEPEKDIRLVGAAAVARAKELLLAEHILLVKSVGGFNLVCLATSSRAVAELRKIKHRPTKPFAVMCGTVAKAEQLCHVSSKERELLESRVRPIVLLQPRTDAKRMLAAGVAEQCSALGVMLPPMGLYVELCEIGSLVVTSCNRSGAPIIYRDNEAFAFYRECAAVQGLFTYDREILRPADDAVVRSVRLQQGQTTEVIQVLRRTRGYLPEPLCASFKEAVAKQVLAVGAEMEPSFCLADGSRLYVAQQPGRLEEEQTEAEYRLREQDWEQLLELRPELVVTDLHPGYTATQLGRQLAAAKELSVAQVQHHQAHALSVVAEQGLTGKCLAFCFDGTGYGTDGAVWGGELLLCEEQSFKRVAHLEAITMLGGDSSMRQAWKSAMCYGAELECLQEILQQDSRYAVVRAALAQRINVIQNSSMGRLFDAASFILGLASENTHQGRCAQALEAKAQEALDAGLEPPAMHFAEDTAVWSAKPLWPVLVGARQQGEEAVARAALGFHRAIVKLVVKAAQKQQAEQVVLCGGCFANRILLEGCYKELTALGFKVYFNRQVPPGDGGLALGQAYYGLLTKENKC